ncbi:MAG: DUF3800 domain-containing protein [Candidatus Marinimicrobia bacterium]|nr:DUF3800 domain-containing protein [Candidatus Neomarinimicrobiota bacterium]MCH8068630.1 DUF3800 domain-containing protein [Candidatus Neomarinimicrobiota bacterium]
MGKKIKDYHRFLDESGDTTFFGKRKRIIVGNPGISKTFILGMVKFKTDFEEIRRDIIELQNNVVSDVFYKDVPSIKKRVNKYGFYFHAKDDIPEVREKFFRYIQTVNCSFEAVVGRKIPDLYINKHQSNEAYFYADLLSHLLKNKLQRHEKFVLNISSRGKCTKNHNLELSLAKAKQRFSAKKPEKDIITKVVFNVQNHLVEPLLNIADYFCWSIQKVFEGGNVRFYNFLSHQISQVIDLYDSDSYGKEGWPNYYGPKNKLTSENEISPPLH